MAAGAALAGSRQVAFWTVVLTALYPIWFAQSTLAQADIFAAACTLWGLVYALPDRDRKPRIAAHVVHRGGAVEGDGHRGSDDAGGHRAGGWISRGDQPETRSLLDRRGLARKLCLPLIAWYAWHYAKTGFVFGNPEYLHYNAEANLAPSRFLAAFGHRLLHLTAHMNMFVPVLLTMAALMLKPRLDAEGHERPRISKPILWRIFLYSAGERGVVQRAGRRAADALPAAHVSAGAAGCGVDVLAPRAVLAGLGCVFGRRRFIAGLFINPPYRFAPEDNLEYARVIRLHMAGIAQLNKRYRRGDGAVGVAGDRRADEARAGIREDARTRSTGSKISPQNADRSCRRRSRRVLERPGLFDQVRSVHRCC